MEDLIRGLISLLDPRRMYRGKVSFVQGSAASFAFEVAHPWIKHGCDLKAMQDATDVIEDMSLLGRYSIRLDTAQYVVTNTPLVGAFRVVVSFENPVDAVHYRLRCS